MRPVFLVLLLLCLPLTALADQIFIRGDSNGDGEISLPDVLQNLNYQFLGGPPSACLKSQDVNDDGFVTLFDATDTLNYLFQGDRPPLPPFPKCGADPTPDDISCLSPTEVCSPSELPKITSIPPTQGLVDTVYIYDVVATGSAPLTFAVVGPSNANIDEQAGRILWTPAQRHKGFNAFEITVTDNLGLSSTQKFEVEIGPLTIPGDAGLGVFLGSTLEFTLDVPAPANVSPMPLPNNMTFDMATGEFHFVPEQCQVGEIFELTFSLRGSQQTLEVTITVKEQQGPTTLVGIVRDSDTEQPLADVEVRIGTMLSVTTGPNGEFTLTNVPDDAEVLQVDGMNLSPPYAFVAEPLELLLEHELFPGQTNEIVRPVFIPELGDPAGKIDPDDTDPPCLEGPEGVVLCVAQGTAEDPNGGLFAGDVYIPEVPAENTPVALPENLNPALVVAIQPGAVTRANIIIAQVIPSSGPFLSLNTPSPGVTSVMIICNDRERFKTILKFH